MTTTEYLRARSQPGPDGCVLWTAAKNYGYGVFCVGGRMHRAHRVAYELAKGPIPAGLQIDHLCRVRDCINPEHLEAVTAGENVRRAAAVRPPTCSKGHRAFRRHPGGRKYCAACKAAYDRARYAAGIRRVS